MLAVGASRIALAAWQVVRPYSSTTERTPSGLVMTVIVWTTTLVLLIWARWYGAH